MQMVLISSVRNFNSYSIENKQTFKVSRCLAAAFYDRENALRIAGFLWRVLLFLAGAAGFTGLVMPLIKRRILNIGNAAGLAACIMLMLYALFMPYFNMLIGKWWQKTTGKIIISVIGVIIVLGIVLVVIMSACMIKSSCTKPAQNATAIVLGCRVYGERPSIILTERMDAAILYLNENPDAVCIASGGQGSDEDISEAECIYRYLVQNGINPTRIYIEDNSTSTRENLAFSYELIKENALPIEIAIVTNEFHEYRAGLIAKELGLSYGAVPAKTALWLFPTYYARELFGVLYEWLT